MRGGRGLRLLGQAQGRGAGSAGKESPGRSGGPRTKSPARSHAGSTHRGSWGSGVACPVVEFSWKPRRTFLAWHLCLQAALSLSWTR